MCTDHLPNCKHVLRVRNEKIVSEHDQKYWEYQNSDGVLHVLIQTRLFSEQTAAAANQLSSLFFLFLILVLLAVNKVTH